MANVALRALKEKIDGQAEATPKVAAGSDQAAPNSRAGKVHLGAWLSPAYKTSLRTIQLKAPEKTFQELFTEALDLLFTKYDVPRID